MLDQLINSIKSLPNDLKLKAIGAVTNILLASSNVEKDNLSNMSSGQVNIGGGGGETVSREQIGNILEQMRSGQINEAYVQYFYTVLKKADDFINKSTEEEIQQAVSRLGLRLDNENDLGEVFAAKSITGNKYTINERLSLANNKRTHKIEQTIKNEVFLVNYDKHYLHGEKPRYEYKINISRNIETNNRIEQLLDFVNICTNYSNEKIIEFHILKKYNLAKYVGTQIYRDLTNFSYLSFQNIYGEDFLYKIHGIYGFEENNSHDIIVMNGNYIVNL